MPQRSKFYIIWSYCICAYILTDSSCLEPNRCENSLISGKSKIVFEVNQDSVPYTKLLMYEAGLTIYISI